ncbi:MAG TPA: hypothetical protein VFH55_13305 [Nitrospiria bacterium]|nr:hypothetical protein [Nitrospiria bacterium]
MKGPAEIPLKRPLDITIFGVLFLLSAPVELVNILSTGWQYTPKFFGITTHGIVAKGVLAAQPILHLALGYGFLTLRRWVVYVGLFYIGDVLTSAVSSFILYGYGRVRTLFIVLLVPFLIYLIARRAQFKR